MGTTRLEPLGHIALLVAALLACGNSKNDAADKPLPPEKGIAVKAADLIADYKANEVRGDAKWKGKLVRVAGFVVDVKKDITDTPYITLGTHSDARLEFPKVQCSMRDGQEAKAGSLSKTQVVVLQGRVKGLLMNVLVDDCEVFLEGQDPATRGQPAAPAHPPAKRK